MSAAFDLVDVLTVCIWPGQSVPFNFLLSWTVSVPGKTTYQQLICFPMKTEGESFQSQDAGSDPFLDDTKSWGQRPRPRLHGHAESLPGDQTNQESVPEKQTRFQKHSHIRLLWERIQKSVTIILWFPCLLQLYPHQIRALVVIWSQMFVTLINRFL